MPTNLSLSRNSLAKVVHALGSLRTDQRGNVAVMMAFLLPVLCGAMGIGFEVTNWYRQTRGMQNAADSAALAAADNASSNYDIEAGAVAAQYGFVNGSQNVTVTASNTATCPTGGTTCYSVTITSLVPLYLSQVVGYRGDATLNGAPQKSLTSTAIAKKLDTPTQVCLLALASSGTSPALRSDGTATANMGGCNVMSNTSATCNGHNLGAGYGLANGTDNGCGINGISGAPKLPDPYSGLASNIPKNTCGSYFQEPQKKKDPALPASNLWSGTQTWAAGGVNQICGDLQLTGNTVINAPNGVLLIENGQLDTNGYTLSTASGAPVTVIFSGQNGSGPVGPYLHAPTDNSGGGAGTLDIQAPTSGPWSGVAIYQDPSLLTGVDIAAAGNDPTWKITGLVYAPHASVNFNGAVNKSSNGASCFVLVVDNVTISGTGSILETGGCGPAGLTMPTEIIKGRAQLVF